MQPSDMNEANRLFWDAQAPAWRELREQDQLWRRIPQQPALAFEGEALAMIEQYAGSVSGRQACVIASGDNYVSFALAGMGAHVTSTDISNEQLAVARARASELALPIDFLRADATELNGIPDNTFDLVCSSNGFFVWVAEPQKVFHQVRRVLKPGGYYIFYDVHPFQRPWKNQVLPLEMAQPYTETGPFEDSDGAHLCYEFHWRMSDLLNPLADAGLILRQIAESPSKDTNFWEGMAYTPGQASHLSNWQNNPRAGLPVWLSVAAQKPAL